MARRIEPQEICMLCDKSPCECEKRRKRKVSNKAKPEEANHA